MEYLSKQRYDEISAKLNHPINEVYPTVQEDLADMVIDGVLKVEKYDDRFVFTNPGLLKIPVEQIYSGYETRARNQRIQNMFRMIGFGENLGSGFPLILSAWNEKHWLEPELIEQKDLKQVKLVLHFHSENVVKDVGKGKSHRKDCPKRFGRLEETGDSLSHRRTFQRRMDYQRAVIRAGRTTKKSRRFLSDSLSGADEARTRDPRRDR